MQDTDSQTPSPEHDDGKFSSQSRAVCLTMFQRAEATGNLEEALLWAKQAGKLTPSDADADTTKEVNATFAQLIVAGCHTGQRLALRSGNVYDVHQLLARIILDASEQLLARVAAGEKQIPIAAATVIEGFARQMDTRIQAHLNKRNFAVTDAKLLSAVLEDYDQILEYASKLTLLSDELIVPIVERLAIAEIAAQNARVSIVGGLGRWLSDWDKAAVYAQRSHDIVAAALKTLEAGDAVQRNAGADALRALAALTHARVSLSKREVRNCKSELQDAEDFIKLAVSALS